MNLKRILRPRYGLEVKKYVRIMKLTWFLILALTLQTNANLWSQTTKMDLDMQNSTLLELFTHIENNSNYRFFYSNDEIDVTQKVSLSVKDRTIGDILDVAFDGLPYSFKELQNNMILVELKNNVKSVGQQTKTVSGAVTDEKGEPLPGVTVVIKGSMEGTITDIDGKFTLSGVTTESVLHFSFVGMITQEVPVGNQATINVKMELDAIGIDEVVAIGYGTMKKSDLTGSITQVKADDLAVVSSSNPAEALQGRAAGVAVSTDNQPGSSPTIRIRGGGSISAGNDPLIVVDGFPLVDANLNDFNPHDIESIEILKDASSTAIYGSRGANGIIMLTTKSGAAGRNELSVNSYYGFQTPARLVEMLNRDEFISFINEAYTYSNGQPVYTESSPAPNNNTDWQKELFRDNSAVQDHSITFSGGVKSTKYMISADLYSQDGLLGKSGFERFSVRTNLNHEFSKWLTVGSHIQASRATTNIDEGSPDGIFRFGWPTMPVKNEDGSWYYASLDPQHSAYVEGNWNPVADAEELTNTSSTDRIVGDLFAQFTIIDGLTFKTNFGADISNTKNYYYATSNHSSGMSSGGVGSQSYLRKTTKITENILTYAKSIDDHRVTLTGVYSYQDYLYESMGLSGSGFPTDVTGANNMSLADVASISYSTDKYSSKLISWTARAMYAYQDKYMLTATGRYDGSSRFGANNKWGFFPSVGFGWRINNESFLQGNENISNLKLRGSYGVTGNQEISNYASLPSLSDVNYIFGNTPILGFKESLGNPNLKWERTAQIDVGVDIGLWNRVNVTLDYYKRNTTDLLYNVPIPTTSGFSSMLQNIGEVENQGFEFSANARVIDRELKWDVNVNLSKNKNQVVELYGDVEEINLGEEQGVAQFLNVGDPISGVWARESAGIITTQEQLDAYQEIRSTAQLGEEMYADNTPDNSINSDDYILIGTTDPNFFYGLSTTLEYKNIKLNVYGQGATNIATTATDYLIYGENQIQNRNYIPSKYAYDRMWSESNPNGIFPRAGAREIYPSDRTNGGRNYFIIKNIRLSYNLKSTLLRDADWVKDFNVFTNVQNFVSFSNFRGYNPENGNVNYPLAKALIFGINVNF